MRVAIKFIIALCIMTLALSVSGATKQNMQKHIDFTNQEEAQNWVIVNDTVMGGRSRASVVLENDMLLFSGDLSLQNNGGFASTRRIYGAINWDGTQALEIKIMGDGRAYQFRLRTNKNFDGVAYVANFNTEKGSAQTLRFNIDDFIPQFRGRIVSNAPKLNYADVSQFGFMLADKNPGRFTLKVEFIRQVPEPV